MTTAARPPLSPMLLVLLALLSAFTPLSIDMYLPALPTIAALGQNSTYNTHLITRNVLFLPR